MHTSNVQPAKKTIEEILSAKLPILPMTVGCQELWKIMPNELLIYSVVHGSVYSLYTYTPEALNRISEVFSELFIDESTRRTTTLSELVKLEEWIVNRCPGESAYKIHSLLLESIANATLTAADAQRLPVAFSAETLRLINGNPAQFIETATRELEAMSSRYTPALVEQSRSMLASFIQEHAAQRSLMDNCSAATQQQ